MQFTNWFCEEMQQMTSEINEALDKRRSKKDIDTNTEDQK